MSKAKTLTKTDTAASVEEVEFQGAQAADGSAVAANNAAGFAFVPKVKKILTLPLLKMKIGEPVYVKFTAPTFVGKKIAEEPGKVAKEPPIMANVINLPTGEMVQIMLGSVLQGILRDEYPNDSYVGKSFMLQLAEQKRGRLGGNYNTYKVAELDD